MNSADCPPIACSRPRIGGGGACGDWLHCYAGNCWNMPTIGREVSDDPSILMSCSETDQIRCDICVTVEGDSGRPPYNMCCSEEQQCGGSGCWNTDMCVDGHCVNTGTRSARATLSARTSAAAATAKGKTPAAAPTRARRPPAVAPIRITSAQLHLQPHDDSPLGELTGRSPTIAVPPPRCRSCKPPYRQPHPT